MVDEKTWHRLMTLPSDVSIRTSDYHGSFLKCQRDILEHWVIATMPVPEVDERADPVSWAMLAASDELEAATFEMLHGFYRQAAASLRSALELMIEGCARGLSGESAMELGSERFSFGRLANEIS